LANHRHKDQFDLAYESYVADGRSDESLQRLLKMCESYIRRIAYSKVRQYIDDVTQNALLALWRSLPRYNPALAGLKHYIRLTTKAAINRHLAQMYTSPVTCNIDDVTIQPDSDSDPYDAYNRLSEVIDAPTQLLSALLRGDSLCEAARVAGISRKAARCAIDRAIKLARIS
jgi:DNA-directed RNA polymerase specialized sigma24 family protein